MPKKIRIHLVAAARPNFMKIAPLYHALKQERWATPIIIHTGQHYDKSMSAAFFTDLRMPKPHINLGIGSGTHAQQTANVLIAYEKLCLDSRPDLTIVVGDVNSTLACALAATKLNIPVAHLEAGLRSFDRSMPEEINRILTDSIANILWTPSPDADKNLQKEGIAKNKIYRVGNIMIDSLIMSQKSRRKDSIEKKLKLKKQNYGVVTLHRPSNVDSKITLRQLITLLEQIAKKITLVFPVHPRTFKNLKKTHLLKQLHRTKNLIITEALPYKAFMHLISNARFALTDSGGIQEETSYLGIPCLTLRNNTERPITITAGTNKLTNIHNARKDIDKLLQKPMPKKKKIPLWDGQTAKRIVTSLRRML